MSATSQEVHYLELNAPIHRVLVMEDRAQVTRRGSLQLPVGLCRLRVHDVSPLCVERSLRLRRESAQSLQILELRLIHEVLSTPQRQDASLQQEFDVLEREMKDIHEEKRRKQQQAAILQQAQEELFEQIRRQAGLNQTEISSWQSALQTLRTRKEALQEALHDLVRSLNEKSDQRIQLENKTKLTVQPAPKLRVHLEALIEVAEEQEATLAWDYLVPCALWRPVHQAQLTLHEPSSTQDGEQAGDINFETSAMIWQRTGEDWQDVAIACSTARTTQAASPPLLQDEVLTSRKKTTEEKKTIVASFRNEAKQRTGQAAKAPSVPCVDDGGEARYFEAKQPANIPSNGQPVRIPLFSWSAPTKASLVCTPEVQTAVMLRTEQANHGLHPILAGPVRLIRQSGYIGQTSLQYTAPQERFSLGWGSEDRLRVQRDVVLLRDTQGLSGRQVFTWRITLHLSNLADQEIALSLRERIPTSELEKVEIRLLKQAKEPEDPNVTKPPPHEGPDESGFLSWSVQLQPLARERFTLAYELQAPSHVVLDF